MPVKYKFANRSLMMANIQQQWTQRSGFVVVVSWSLLVVRRFHDLEDEQQVRPGEAEKSEAGEEGIVFQFGCGRTLAEDVHTGGLLANWLQSERGRERERESNLLLLPSFPIQSSPVLSHPIAAT